MHISAQDRRGKYDPGRRNFCGFLSFIYISSPFKKSSCTAEALLEMSRRCKARRIDLTVLYMVGKLKDICYMEVR